MKLYLVRQSFVRNLNSSPNVSNYLWWLNMDILYTVYNTTPGPQKLFLTITYDIIYHIVSFCWFLPNDELPFFLEVSFLLNIIIFFGQGHPFLFFSSYMLVHNSFYLQWVYFFRVVRPVIVRKGWIYSKRYSLIVCVACSLCLTSLASCFQVDSNSRVTGR